MDYQEWARRNLVEPVGFFNQALIGDDQQARSAWIDAVHTGTRDRLKRVSLKLVMR